MSDPFIEYSESMVATVAKLFALEGSAKEVAILAHAVLEVVQTNFLTIGMAELIFILSICIYR
ncbi:MULTISPECIES: hypothetical protein [unclassified Carboxydocella]|uniref:hypothetical protein n=1 Tax=unclassified Carboxydocella TaxID=2685367 RepID=UPI0009D52EE7|nr:MULTISPECIES: hypothetical protein [unclassified Carboxydocella]GAW31971.1 hypothetical protein JDF658_17360 [Carboxydocella sp. JDF658]